MNGGDTIVRGGDATALLAALPARVEDAVARSAAAHPNHLAIVASEGSCTYMQLADLVRQMAGFLAEQGLCPGQRVLILGENGLAMAVFMLAAMSLRAWAVPLNPKLAPREIDDIRDHAAASLAIYCLGAAPQARAHATRHGARMLQLPSLGEIGVAVPPATAMAAADGADNDVAVLIYTSGSSGRPKGVKLTHRNLLYMAAASGAVRHLTPEDRFYLVLPLSHIVGLAVILLGGLMHGVTIQLAARFTPQSLLAALRDDGVTILLATPALIGLLLDYTSRSGAIIAPRLRIISVSGAPLDGTTKAAAETMFGLKLHHGYGITECSPTIAQVRPEDPRPDISVGPLLPGVEARLVGAAPGEPGELHVRGPNIMAGYFRAPELTAEAIDAEGWFNTGDLARFDGENLTIVGRTKEMVIRFGFNVYPAEVEAAIAAHASVQACAVIGRAAGGEEQLIAFVQPAAGTAPAEAELMRHAAAQLAPYKRPTRIVTLDTLPRTASGKWHKQELLAWLQAESC